MTYQSVYTASLAVTLTVIASSSCSLRLKLVIPKSLMGLIGLDCGPVRLPLQNLSAAQRDQLRGDLEAMGFLPGCQ